MDFQIVYFISLLFISPLQSLSHQLLLSLSIAIALPPQKNFSSYFLVFGKCWVTPHRLYCDSLTLTHRKAPAMVPSFVQVKAKPATLLKRDAIGSASCHFNKHFSGYLLCRTLTISCFLSDGTNVPFFFMINKNTLTGPAYCKKTTTF